MRALWIIQWGFAACGPVMLHPPTVATCIDEGGARDVVPPGVGDLVITEVMPKPKRWSAAAAQWFEIVATADVDLNGVGIDRANDVGGRPEIISTPECVHLAAGSYAVFARSNDSASNGNVRPIATFSFSLNPNGSADVQLIQGAEVIDRVAWSTAPSGASLQLDPGTTDAVANDDSTNFCNALTSYDATGGNFGTPGTENPPCPPAESAGQCIDEGAMRPIVKPTMGQLVLTEFLANTRGSGNDKNQEWFEIANIGPRAFDLNGITFSGSSASDTVTAMECTSVAPGSVALLAHSADPAVNGGLPSVDATFTFALANSNGSISAFDGSTLLDRIAWTTPAQGDGIARQLKPTQLHPVANDAEDNYCAARAAQEYGDRGNVGTPRAENVCL